MRTFKTKKEAEKFFKQDKFAENIGIKIDELKENTCKCKLELKEEHKNAYGGVMGGVIFTLADFTFAVLSNHIHQPTIGQQVNINYLNSVKGNTLISTATIRKTGKSSTIINVDIEDNTGRDIAQFTGTGFKLQK